MKKILIVEDDAIVRQVYQTKFKLEGFEVKTAADGKAAVEVLRDFLPAVVLLDLMMPGISGIEVLKFIRSQPELRSTPVVVFTNSYLGDMVQEAWKVGANKCLLKADCTPQVVAEVVRKTIESMGRLPAASDIADEFKTARARRLSTAATGKSADAAVAPASVGDGKASGRADAVNVMQNQAGRTP
jgi:CheY-like chemotaxis protein